MEQYQINKRTVPTVKRGRYFDMIHKMHITAYGETGAKNIVKNVSPIYSSILTQLARSENHNSLLVGKVQSGKTSNLELLTAFAFDNGYNFLIIYGGYDTDLLKQTTERFGQSFNTQGDVLVSENPVLFTTNELTEGSLELKDLDADFAKEVLNEKRPIIIACLKRHVAMKNVNNIIANLQSEGVNLKPFIIDDEGDQASLNTKKDKKNDASTTYNEICKMKTLLDNPLYLAVTATPQANIFQSKWSNLIPETIHLIQPATGYDGASTYHLTESSIIEHIKDNDVTIEFNESLKQAILYFFIASAIKRKRAQQPKDRRSDMIIHVAREINTHGQLYSNVYDFLKQIKDTVNNKDIDDWKIYQKQLVSCYENHCSKVLKECFPIDCLWEDIKDTVKTTGVILKNGIGKKLSGGDKTKYHCIYIGGDLLQRGLTFKNLITTYFTRWAEKGGNMDTNLQRARWFGYREKYIDLCKIFTTSNIAYEFSALADIEDDLWEQFEDVEKGLLTINEILIQSDDTKQSPTSKSKGKYKKVSFKRRWISQRFIVTDEQRIKCNNEKIDNIINQVSWQETTAGSIHGKRTGDYAILSPDLLHDLINSIEEAFDREPFAKKALHNLISQDEIPVILMPMEDDRGRYRTLYNDDIQQERIKALLQGKNNSNVEKMTYMGDREVIVRPDSVNIQIHKVSPGLSKDNRLDKEQYMFAIYVPKNKQYFVKEDEE